MQKPFVKWGMIAAGISIILTLVIYLVNSDAINGFLSGFLTFAVMVYCAVRASQEEREFQGGYMTWGQALVPALLTILIYMILTMLFSYILVTMIDPTLGEAQMKAALEMQEKVMNLMGGEMTEDQIQEIRERAKPTMWNTLVGIFSGMLCLGFPVSAIIALFIQKKNPENDLLA